MEDRHSLSEPRLRSSSDEKSSNTDNTNVNVNVNASSSLVWLVDIYRKGVTNPVDTIEICNESLPPRLNKKGKVLWRLPKDKDRLVSEKDTFIFKKYF